MPDLCDPLYDELAKFRRFALWGRSSGKGLDWKSRILRSKRVGWLQEKLVFVWHNFDMPEDGCSIVVVSLFTHP
jgi:hypothetical protein